MTTIYKRTLVSISVGLPKMEGLFDDAHSPQAASRVIQKAQDYEEILCGIIGQGNEQEKVRAVDFYARLQPVLRCESYNLGKETRPGPAFGSYIDDS